MGKRQKAKEMAEAKAARKAAGKAARQTYGPPMHIYIMPTWCPHRTYIVPTSYLNRTYMVPMPTLHGAYMGAGFGVKGDFSYHCMENTGHGQIIPIV